MKFNPARRASKNKERPSSTFAADIGLSGGTGGGGIQSGSRQPKAVAASGEVVRRPADCPCPCGPPVAQPATPTRSAIASRAVRDLMAEPSPLGQPRGESPLETGRTPDHLPLRRGRVKQSRPAREERDHAPERQERAEIGRAVELTTTDPPHETTHCALS